MRVLWAISGHSGGSGEPEAVSAACGCAVEKAAGGLDAIASVRACAYDAVVGEFPMPGWTPEEWLEELRRADRNLPAIVRTRRGSCRDAVRLTKLGAYDYIDGQCAPEEIARVVREACRGRRLGPGGNGPEAEPWKRLLVGESRPIKNVEQIIRMIAPRRSTVLITGETGTGKEMAARAIHMASGRSAQPFVAVNCSALPEALLEAELFGHVKGAFTGAFTQRVGRFEQANHGTLFLDEIGDMPLDLQAKLLRVVQERELQRLGSSETLKLDVRIVAASNADLAGRVREGKFREDLYYRLNVVPIRMPGLRERLSDIPLLAHHFIDKICRLEDVARKEISREALDRLCGYTWPGNVRQLENAVEMAVALSGDAGVLSPADFPLPAESPSKYAESPAAPVIRLPDDGLDFESTVTRIERSILEQALERTRGNKKLAARMLRLKRTTLSAKLKSLGEACGASPRPATPSQAVPMTA
ncbi:MAG: sigma-54 dependent transcriptional regulator [Acidobacteriota bacterium]